MTIFLLACGALGLVIAGRRVFGSWFNHVSLYSAIWGTSLVLFETRFIDYVRLETETWVYILCAWAAFVLGALLLPSAGLEVGSPRTGGGSGSVTRDADDARLRIIRWTVVALSAVALVAVLQHWMILLNRFGSVRNVLVLGNIVYSLRVSEGLEGEIPYLDSLALAASMFGGMYAAMNRRIGLVAILPVAVVLLEAVGLMGRAKILIALVLFASGYMLTGRNLPGPAAGRAATRLRRWLAAGLAAALIVSAAEFIRSNRGMIESIPGSRQSLAALRGGAFITPSLYLYLTVHHGIFNQYLRGDGEDQLVGANTFTPIYKVLAKFGLDTEVATYGRFYRTPASANTGTYLRDLHADFGPAGCFVVPFLLGFACTWWWRSWFIRRSLVQLAALAHGYVLVVLSFVVFGPRLGYWFLSLLISMAIGRVLDRRRALAWNVPADPAAAGPAPAAPLRESGAR